MGLVSEYNYYTNMFKGNYIKGANTLKNATKIQAFMDDLTASDAAMSVIFEPNPSGMPRLLPSAFLKGNYEVGKGVKRYVRLFNSTFNNSNCMDPKDTAYSIGTDTACVTDISNEPVAAEILGLSVDFRKGVLASAATAKLMMKPNVSPFFYNRNSYNVVNTHVGAGNLNEANTNLGIALLSGKTMPFSNMNSGIYKIYRVGNYLYIVEDGSNTGYIYKAAISDLIWADTGFKLPLISSTYMQYSNLAVLDDGVYLFGGYNTLQIYKAPLDNPCAFNPTGKSMPNGIGSCVSNLNPPIVIGDYIYLIGSYNGINKSISRAPLNDVLNWTILSTNFPTFTGTPYVFVVGDYIYAYDISGTSMPIYRAPITDPTAWVNTGKFIGATANSDSSQMAILGDYIYLFGTGLSAYTQIYRAPITDPTTWTQASGKSLPIDLRSRTKPAVIDNTIYFFGSQLSPYTQIYKGTLA